MVSGELLPCSANEGRFPDKFQSLEYLEFVWNLSEICLEFSGVFKPQGIPNKFQSLEFVWDLSGISWGLKAPEKPKQIPDKFQTLEFVWNR